MPSTNNDNALPTAPSYTSADATSSDKNKIIKTIASRFGACLTQSGMRQAGWAHCELLSYGDLIGHPVHTLCRQLAQAYATLLWIDLPTRHGFEHQRRPQRLLHSLLSILRAQSNHGGHIIIVSDSKNALWTTDFLAQARLFVPHEAYISWCALRIPAVVDEGLSSRVDRLWASFSIDAQPCTCEQPWITHVHDARPDDHRSPQAEARRQARDDQQQLYVRRLAEHVDRAMKRHGVEGPAESISTATSSTTPSPNFPTEARMRAKLKQLDKPKDAVKRRKFPIEHHYDDCGDSTEGLGGYFQDYLGHVFGDNLDELEDVADDRHLMYGIASQSIAHHFYGREDSNFPNTDSHRTTDDPCADVHELRWRTHGPARFLELSGTYMGNMRVSINGKGCMVDFLDQHAKATMDDMLRSPVAVALMSPPATSFYHSNRIDEYRETVAGQACCDFAQQQLRHGYGFIVEYPDGYGHFDTPWWQGLRRQSGVCGVLADLSINHDGGALHEFWASSPLLLQPLASRMCAGNDLRHSGWRSRIGPWTMNCADTIAHGIDMFIASFYPVSGSHSALAPEITCRACLGRIEKYDDRHTRDPISCKWPHLEARIWECQACKEHKARYAAGHSYLPGDCRWATAPTLGVAERPRAGAHPRDGARPAAMEPTAELRGPPAASDPVDNRDVPDVSDTAASSSTTQPSRRLETTPAPSTPPAADIANDTAASSADADTEVGADGIRRPHRRARVEAATGDDEPADWSSWDLGVARRSLFNGDAATRRRILRKLHLRWFHAPSARMKRLLKAAGVPTDVVSMVDSIVDTCRSCRLWAQHGQRPQSTVKLSTAFNDEVQLDILYHGNYQIGHLIDGCIRWTVATTLEDKDTESLLNFIWTSWIQPFGPMHVLTVDGEGALASEQAAVALERMGTTRRLKAPGQHAQIVERHHEILRRQLCLIIAQCTEENLRIPFMRQLAEAVFAKNAFLTIGDGTPYKALYGRVPLLLRDFDLSGAQNIDDAEGGGAEGLIRHTHRLREISVQSIVEATAQDRMRRAVNARTTPTIEDLHLQGGDLVDIYRRPLSKDLPGWRGPATVISAVSPESGNITVKWQGHEMAVRRADLRRAILFWQAYLTREERSPAQIAMDFAEQVNTGYIHIGWASTESGWMLTKNSQRYPWLLVAIMALASCGLHLSGCIAARLGRRAPQLPGLHDFEQATLCWWDGSQSQSLVDYTEHDASDSVNLRNMFGQKWESTSFIQFLTADSDVVGQAHAQQPHVPHVGGPSLPGVELWRQHQQLPALPPQPATAITDDTAADAGAVKRPRSAGSSASGNPSPHVSRSLPNLKRTRSNNSEGSGNPSPDKAANAPDEATTETMQSDVPEDPGEPDEDEKPPTAEEFWSLPRPSHSNGEVNEWDDVFWCTTGPDISAVGRTPVIENYHVLEAWAAASSRAGLPRAPDGQDRNLASILPNLRKALPEIGFTAVMWPFLDTPAVAGPANHPSDVIVIALLENGKRSAVIERDDNVLGKAEKQEHAQALRSARLKELRQWVEHKAFHRVPRRHARNLIDATWVDKWKWVQDDKDVWARVIRSRMTVRGFKDRQAQDVLTFTGTCSRWGQRVVNITATQQSWIISCADISSAFLRGMTFEEAAKLLGEPLREVHFDLPDNTAELLAEIKGFEGFNAALECLHMDKGGFGLKDAPRLFGLKRDQVLRDFGALPTHADPQLWVKHDGGELVAIFSTHLDDLKIAASDKTTGELVHALEEVFGQLKLQKSTFIHCGIRHTQDPTTYVVIADQALYADNLRLIDETPLAGSADIDLVDYQMQKQYMSLLGGIAWCVLTMPHIAIYVAALQRAAKQPTAGHLRRLNTLVSYAKQNPHGIHTVKLTPPVALVEVGDAAFRREPNDQGLAMRGAFLLLVETDGMTSPGGRCNVVDYYAKKQSHVVRSTWGAELAQLSDGADNLLVLHGFFHEVRHGATSSRLLRDLVDRGSSDELPAMPMHACIDAQSVYAAITAEVIGMPAERHTLYHAQWVRELLDSRTLEALWWIDTRDCCADGLTKGTVLRDAIVAIMKGNWKILHECKRWPTKRTKP